MIAALYVHPRGPYFDRADVDPWDEARDARAYAGPWPVVAHPPCARWGRYWSGGPSPLAKRRALGDDGGCFAAALAAVRRWGGVLEHPEASHAWRAHGIVLPPKSGGWVSAGLCGGWTCCVEQGHYGHPASKATWLYVHGVPGSDGARATGQDRGTPAAVCGPEVPDAAPVRGGVDRHCAKFNQGCLTTRLDCAIMGSLERRTNMETKTQRATTVELRKVRINQRMSAETLCFSAEIWRDGAKIADVANRGCGGCNEYHFRSAADASAFSAWAAAQPHQLPDFEVEDQAISALLEDYEVQQAVAKLKKRCATKTLFRTGAEGAGAYRELAAPFAIGRAHVLKQFPSADFINDWTDQALRSFVAPVGAA